MQMSVQLLHNGKLTIYLATKNCVVYNHGFITITRPPAFNVGWPDKEGHGGPCVHCVVMGIGSSDVEGGRDSPSRLCSMSERE